MFKTLTNHPVHILDDEAKMSQSALIPFCSFGDRMDTLGVKVGDFKAPACNSFNSVKRLNQICYEMDLNLGSFNNKSGKGKQLEYGLILILDFNEERQWDFENEIHFHEGKEEINLYIPDDSNGIKVHLETISNTLKQLIMSSNNFTYLFLGPVTLSGEGQYNLNILKEIKVTDSFLKLPRKVRGCQNETFHDQCITRLYMETAGMKCGCLPISIASFEVHTWYLFHLIYVSFILVNISLRFSMASRLSKNNQSSPPGQDWLLWITSETREDDLVI